MEFKNKIAIDRATREATIHLYGIIGDKIDGDYLGREIDYLDQNADVINIRINSDGGSVSQGLSIVSAILKAQALVNCFVDGIAASMAAVIALCGDKVYMNDYAQIMIHDPAYADEKGNIIKKLSPKDQKSLNSLKEILVNLLSRSGKDKETVSKLMTAETWFNAEAAIAEGLVHEVISTSRKAELVALQPRQLVAQLIEEDERIINPNKETMKQVIARYGLAEEATEEQVLSAIDQRESGLQADKTLLVDKLIAVGKHSGLVTDKNEASMRKLADTDIALFNDLLDVEKIEVPAARLSEAIARLNELAKPATSDDTRKYNEYSESELKTMRANNKAQFDKLFAEWSAQ
jgi:ATP-dependent protease ClpP protease subunit